MNFFLQANYDRLGGATILCIDKDSEVRLGKKTKINNVSYRHRKWVCNTWTQDDGMLLQPWEQYGVLLVEQKSFPVGRTKI